MARQILVNKNQVTLPNGHTGNTGQVFVLTDEEFAQLAAGVADGTFTDEGELPDAAHKVTVNKANVGLPISINDPQNDDQGVGSEHVYGIGTVVYLSEQDFSRVAPNLFTDGTLTDGGIQPTAGMPTLTSATPDTASHLTQTSVVLAGSGFLAGAEVTFDGIPALVTTVNSNSQITTTTPTGEPITLTTPTAPTITNGGAAGTTTYQYQVTALNTQGYQTNASPTGQTTTGNAVLSGTNYNIVTIATVTNAASYDVYRYNGTAFVFIANTTTTTLNDIGQVATTANPPATNGTIGTVTVTTSGGAVSIPFSFS